MAYEHAGIVEVVLGRVPSNPTATLATLAVELGVHRHTVQRALNKCLGRTFRELQKEAIDLQAADLLRACNRSIKEVALEMGYRSPHSLSRRLKRDVGATASVLRNRGGKLEHSAPEWAKRRATSD